MNNMKIGTCPHGMPAGSCPICNGGGGGAGSSSRRKAGEMSWNECYSMGIAMKAAKHNAEMAKKMDEANFQNSIIASKTAENIAQKMAANQNSFMNNSIGSSIAKTFDKLAQINSNITQGIAKLTTQIANSVSDFVNKAVQQFNQIKEKFVNIMDKLTAIFGEKEQALTKFVSEKLGSLKKKLFGFFQKVDTEMEQGENEEDVELRRSLKLNKLKDKITSIFKSKNDKEMVNNA